MPVSNPSRPVGKKNYREQNRLLEALGRKICSGCGLEKAFSEFHKHKARKHGLGNYCKQCRSEAQKKRIRSNPREYEKKRRLYHDTQRWKDLLKQYGITKEQYEEMERSQDGKCAICKKEETFAVKGELMEHGTVRKLCVDHYHDEPPVVRGLLCTRCNRGIGYFDDDPALLINAANYLTTHHSEVSNGSRFDSAG